MSQPLRSPLAPGLTTEKLAAALDMEPQSIRRRYSKTGAYFCLIPEKLPNRHLRWPLNSVDLLLERGRT
jgi:hypothetical protein